MNVHRKKKLFFAALIFPFIVHSKPIYQWKIDKEKSSIFFEIPILFSSVKGNFNNFSIKNFFYSGYYRSLKKNELWIEISSLSTGSQYRDESIKSKYFLNAKKYPYSIVRIQEIYPLSQTGNIFLVTFEIQIKSIQKQFTELLYFEQNQNKLIFKGMISFPRNSFDLKGNLLLDLLMDQWIRCEYHIELVYVKK